MAEEEAGFSRLSRLLQAKAGFFRPKEAGSAGVSRLLQAKAGFFRPKKPALSAKAGSFWPKPASLAKAGFFWPEEALRASVILRPTALRALL